MPIDTCDKIFTIEDHHQALKIWRKKDVKNLDLIHIDAHIDFGFHLVKPLKQVIEEAKTVKDLKQTLERSLAFSRYEKDFERQTNIGNYIYPAMREGIVRNFYWVIPGERHEFEESRKYIKTLIKNLKRQDLYQVSGSRYQVSGKDRIETRLLGRRFVISTLDALPTLKNNVLLDIDTDFLVVDSLKNADATSIIGRRKPWIQPEALVNILQEKIKKPEITTIAYSVNGGFTPIIYKFLGDELSYRLSYKIKSNQEKILLQQNNCKTKTEWLSLLKQMHRHNGFEPSFRQKLFSHIYFNLFNLTSRENYYKQALRLNPRYKVTDNNLGNLYLAKGALKKAEKEFKRIASIDSHNPFPILGLGNIALRRKDYLKAKRYFALALRQKPDLSQALFALAQIEFRLKIFSKAKRLFLKYQGLESMQPHSRYFLGRIYERERDFEKSVQYYKDALSLGLNDIDTIKRLLIIAHRVKAKNDIIKYVLLRFKQFKTNFKKTRRKFTKKPSNIKNLKRITKKIAIVEKLLKRVS